VENVGAGEDVRSSGIRDVVAAEEGGISKRCWNRSDLSLVLAGLVTDVY
jgi:hypothetical protein